LKSWCHLGPELASGTKGEESIFGGRGKDLRGEYGREIQSNAGGVQIPRGNMVRKWRMRHHGTRRGKLYEHQGTNGKHDTAPKVRGARNGGDGPPLPEESRV